MNGYFHSCLFRVFITASKQLSLSLSLSLSLCLSVCLSLCLFVCLNLSLSLSLSLFLSPPPMLIEFVCFHLFIVAPGCPSERHPRRQLVVTGNSARIQDEAPPGSLTCSAYSTVTRDLELKSYSKDN